MYIKEKKKQKIIFRSERPFSIVFAEEIVRREVIKLLGEKISFLYFDIKATELLWYKNGTFADIEKADYLHRIVHVTICVAESANYSNLTGKNKSRTRTVVSKVRLFKTSNEDWLCHKMELLIKEEGKTDQWVMYVYESGFVNHEYLVSNSKNPCFDL